MAQIRMMEREIGRWQREEMDEAFGTDVDEDDEQPGGGRPIDGADAPRNVRQRHGAEHTADVPMIQVPA